MLFLFPPDLHDGAGQSRNFRGPPEDIVTLLNLHDPDRVLREQDRDWAI